MNKKAQFSQEYIEQEIEKLNEIKTHKQATESENPIQNRLTYGTVANLAVLFVYGGWS